MNKILIVEDYSEFADFLSLLLKKNNFSVTVVSCKKEMEDHFRLFTQLNYNRCDAEREDGREICKEIKATNRKLPVLLVSSNPKMLADYVECKADGIISKPFALNEIIAKVNWLLSKSVAINIE